MDFDSIEEKYGPDVDWDKVSDLDLYKLLNDNRQVWETLANDEDGNALQAHFIYGIIRRRTITSLYFLNLFIWDANPFGGPDAPIEQNDMTPDNHQHVIDMFVKKDPGKSLANLSQIKTNLVLYPRGSMKSSWGIVDIIQWVLYDYKIRILVLSAADDLAAAIVNEARGFFRINEAQPTLMNLFWPEHCLLEKNFGPEGEFTTPKWTAQNIKRREATIMSRGVTSSAQGFHFEVIEGDDIVETRNSSETQCSEVIKKFYITRKTLRNFGYCNLRGTRYHEQDLYGEIINKSQLGEFKIDEFSITEKKIVNESRKTQILIGAAMTIKPEAELEMVKFNLPRQSWFRKAGAEGVILLMPHVQTLTYDALLIEYEDNPEAFETQQRQNVLPPTQQMFTREMILNNTVNWMDIPPYGRVTHTWDLNGGKGKKENDFCVGIAVLWDSKGTGYVIDIVCANYPNPTAIAQAIVQFAARHHPDIISIEDSQGIRMLKPTIETEADKLNDKFVSDLARRLYWRPVDTAKDAKKNRISSLYPLVAYGRIKFEFGLKEMERLIEQIIRPVTKTSKNDIPDCLSFQMDFLPPLPQNSADQKRIEEEMKLRRKGDLDKQAWEMIFTENQGTFYQPQIYEVPVEEVYESSKPYVDNEGLDNILGYGLIG